MSLIMTSASRKINQSPADVRLDSLFDYSRVRPKPVIALDDDDDGDDVEIMTSSRQSTSGRQLNSEDVEVGKESFVECEEVVKVVGDDDWMLPPPPKPLTTREISIDPALLKLRQQKRELENIWQASVKNSEEALRLEARVPKAASPQQPESGRRAGGTCDETPNKRQKILLKLQGESGESHGVRIFVDEKLDKLFTHYANNVGKRPRTDFVFRFDGQQLDANKSPKDLDLEDEDIVEVFVRQARK